MGEFNYLKNFSIKVIVVLIIKKSQNLLFFLYYIWITLFPFFLLVNYFYEVVQPIS